MASCGQRSDLFQYLPFGLFRICLESGAYTLHKYCIRSDNAADKSLVLAAAVIIVHFDAGASNSSRGHFSMI